MKKKHQSRHSIVVSFLSSYFLILLVPICIGILIYTESIQVIENEINRANAAILKQLQQNVDKRLADALQLSLNIAVNSKVIGIANMEGQFDAYQHYAFYELTRDFSSYNAANSFIEDFYVYFKKTGFILSPSGSFDPELLYKKMYSANMKYDEWIHFIESPHRREFFQLPPAQAGENFKKSIVLAQTLPLESMNDSQATLVIHLADSVFKKAIENTRWLDQGTVMIINTKNHLLYTTGRNGSMTQMISYDSLSAGDGNIIMKIGNEDMVVSYTRSEIADWLYVSVTPKKIFMKKASAVQNLSLFSLLICLLLGILLVLIFTKRNYNPIQRLIDEIVKKSGLQKSTRLNEYRFIEDALYKIIDEKNNTETLLKRQQNSMKDNFLARLVKGDIGPGSIEHASSLYDIRFASDEFVVMLFYIDDLGSTFSRSDGQNDWENMDMARFVIKNVVEELVSQYHPGHVTLVDEFSVCLVNIGPQGDTDIGRQMSAIVQTAKDFIENNFKTVLSISISSVHRGVEEIKYAYQEAVKAIEYKMLFGSGSIIHFDNIKKSSGYHAVNKDFAISQEQFINCIKTQNYKEAKNIIVQIMKSYTVDNCPPVDLLKIRIFGFINDAVSAFGDSIPSLARDFTQTLNIVERLIGCKTLKQLESEIIRILDEIDLYMQKKQLDMNEDQIEEIKNFIHSNYHNPDLSVTLIADQFHLSVSYLSKFYKNYTGEGLLEYIQKFRMQKAKEAMGTVELNVKEISTMVGYDNIDTFIRLFKKYEGVTPGRYKETRNA